MHKFLSTLSAILLMAVTPLLSAGSADDSHPRVRMQTSMGEIILELDMQKAPVSVANFLAYVEDGFYDGTIFHRVIKNFMIQGGGYTPGFDRKPVHPPVRNEADNGLQNVRGAIAMARTRDPHSATAQFFINSVDNGFLDYRAPTPAGWGYAVFGRVIQGMDIVDRISALPTGPGGPFPRDVPEPLVLIKSVRRLPHP